MNNGPEWMNNDEQAGLASPGAQEPARDAEETAPGSGERTPEPLGAGQGVYLHPGERMASPMDNVALMEVDPEIAGLERDLSAGLKPLELPLGFADRVMAAAEAEDARTKRQAKVVPFRSTFRAWRVVAGGAIAASLLAGSFMVDEIHQRRERERAAVTQQEFETAVQVSNHALDEARAQLQRAAFRMNK